MKPTDKKNPSSKIRLQVFLSHNGVCSRRRAMEIIQEGRVIVNGNVNTEPSTPVDSHDEILVDNQRIATKAYKYILINKPSGFVTTRQDAHAERIVLDLLPANLRHLMSVGRLDQDTEGLLLLTNDGDVAYKLTHPKFNIDKTYVVVIPGKLDNQSRQKIESGIYLDDGKTSPAVIKNIRSHNNCTEFMLTIHEGKKRQIRRMLAKVGKKVIRLLRISQGPLKLGDLKPGKFRFLTDVEIKQLTSL